jgi:hypothetical protein
MPKISELTAGTSPTGTELVPVVQNGQTVRLSASQLLSGGTSSIAGAVVFENSAGTYSQDATFTFDSTLKKLDLNLTGGTPYAAETDTQFQMSGANGFATTIFMDSFGATAAIDFRHATGTYALRTASATGSTMGQINFQGYDGTAYGKAARVRAIGTPSGATWTLTDHGMRLGFFTTAPGTTTLSEKVSIFGDGGMTIGSALTNEGPGTLNLAALFSNNTLILDSSGNLTGTTVTSVGNLTLGAANTFSFSGRSIIQSSSDGNLTLRNSTGSDFTSLKFGGVTASFPEIKRNATALNFRLADDSADAAITAAGATFSSTVTVNGAAVNVNGPISAATTSAFALTVGAGGANNPALQVDASAGSQVAGLKVTGAATGGTVALAAIDSGSNTNLSIDAKGSGTITLGGTSTGAIIHTRASTFSAAITYGGVTLSNAVSGTGNMALTANTTFTGTTAMAAATITAPLPLTSGGTGNTTESWHYIETLTASASATLTTSAFTSAFDDYQFIFDNIVPATDSVGFNATVESGGSFQATTYLNSVATTTSIDISTVATISNVAGKGFSGQCVIHNVNSTSVNKMMEGRSAFLATGGTAITAAGAGGFWNGGQGAVTRVRFQMTSGNISTGSIKVFGARNN